MTLFEEALSASAADFFARWRSFWRIANIPGLYLTLKFLVIFLLIFLPKFLAKDKNTQPFTNIRFWSVNHTSIYENPESKLFENTKVLVEIFNDSPNILSGTNVYKTFESCWQSLLTILQCTNTASLISK